MLNRRRALMAAQSKSPGGLPDEYQQVEYVTFPTGSERIAVPYILTGMLPSKYEIGFYKTAEATYVSTPYMVCDANVYCREMLYTRGGLGIQKNQSTNYDIASGVTTKDKYCEATISASSAGFDALVTVDGTDYTATVSMTHSIENGNKIYIPGSKTSSQMKGRIYYFKYTENGALKADLVPCYRKADNVCGMYDMVTETFCVNIGSGTIGKGGNV